MKGSNYMKELLETKNEVEIFNNEEFGQIRTIIIDGEPWFIGKDKIGRAHV